MKKLMLILILFFATQLFAAADYLHVTVAGAGNNDGQTWANAFSMTDFITDVNTNAEPGDVYYIKGGTTFTLPADTPIVADNDGTAVAPIYIIGVLAATTHEDAAVVLADYAYDTDRPLFDAAANTEELTFDDYWMIKNLRFLTNSGNGIQADIGSTFENCYSANNKNTATTYEAFTLGSIGSMLISCEATGSAAGAGVNSTSVNSIINCYIHDSAVGINTTSSNVNLISSVIENCTVGFNFGNVSHTSIINNTFDTCASALTATTAYSTLCINNIFNECAAPATWDTENKNNWFDYNSYDGDASGNTNVTVGPHSIDSDITLNADFSLQAASVCLSTGLGITANEGVAGADFKVNIGADQDDNAAGGCDYPAEADVEYGVAYGDSNTGAFVVPAVADVNYSVEYGAAAEFTGTSTLPAVADVNLGVTYGSGGDEYTGTLTPAGSIKSADITSIADAVWANAAALTTVVQADVAKVGGVDADPNRTGYISAMVEFATDGTTPGRAMASADVTTATATAVAADPNIALILADTGTTLPATLATIDGIVDNILVDTGTTIPATIALLPEEVWEDPNASATVSAANIASIAEAVVTDMEANSVTLAAIVADTNELQEDWANAGRLDTIIDSILEDTGTTIPASLTTIDNYIDTEIATIISEQAETDSNVAALIISVAAIPTVDEVWAKSMTDLVAGAPDYDASVFTAINYLYEAWRNKMTTSSTEIAIYKNDASTKLMESDISDDGTTFTKSEYGAAD